MRVRLGVEQDRLEKGNVFVLECELKLCRIKEVAVLDKTKLTKGSYIEDTPTEKFYEGTEKHEIEAVDSLLTSPHCNEVQSVKSTS